MGDHPACSTCGKPIGRPWREEVARRIKRRLLAPLLFMGGCGALLHSPLLKAAYAACPHGHPQTVDPVRHRKAVWAARTVRQISGLCLIAGIFTFVAWLVGPSWQGNSGGAIGTILLLVSWTLGFPRVERPPVGAAMNRWRAMRAHHRAIGRMRRLESRPRPMPAAPSGRPEPPA